MTEQDTFNRLRRPTFAELRELFRALDRWDGYTNFLKSRNKLLKENSWTVAEYHKEFFKTYP